MSDEFSSSTGGTVMQQTCSATEVNLSQSDEDLITDIRRATDTDCEVPQSLADLSVKTSRQLDHSRVILNKSDQSYQLSMYDETLDAYNRNHIQQVFLNGVPIDIHSNGLELEDVAVYVYLTGDTQYVVSIWT